MAAKAAQEYEVRRLTRPAEIDAMVRLLVANMSLPDTPGRTTADEAKTRAGIQSYTDMALDPKVAHFGLIYKPTGKLAGGLSAGPVGVLSPHTLKTHQQLVEIHINAKIGQESLGRILGLNVLPGHRGIGGATMLVREAVGFLRPRFGHIVSETMHGHVTRILEKEGFKAIGRRKGLEPNEFNVYYARGNG